LSRKNGRLNESSGLLTTGTNALTDGVIFWLCFYCVDTCVTSGSVGVLSLFKFSYFCETLLFGLLSAADCGLLAWSKIVIVPCLVAAIGSCPVADLQVLGLLRFKWASDLCRCFQMVSLSCLTFFLT
jgi:hypothetical protein